MYNGNLHKQCFESKDKQPFEKLHLFGKLLISIFRITERNSHFLNYQSKAIREKQKTATLLAYCGYVLVATDGLKRTRAKGIIVGRKAENKKLVEEIKSLAVLGNSNRKIAKLLKISHITVAKYL
jgi:hypothetical protein